LPRCTPDDRLVIFDLDGTLFQTRRVTIPAIQQTLAANGLPVPHEDEIGSYIGRPPREYYGWLAGFCPPGRVQSMIAEMDRRELELVGEAGRLFPGVLEMLEDLRASGMQLAMSSNAPNDYFAKVLDTLNLRVLFRPAYCCGTRFSCKDEIVGAILRERPARSFAVVGDRADDIQSARAHGGFAVAVSYGFGKREDLAAADVIVDSAGAIADAVKALLVETNSSRK